MARQSEQAGVQKARGAETGGGLSTFFGGADPFLRLREDVNRVFDGFFHGWPALRDTATGAAAGLSLGELTPLVDAKETDEAYEITVELPGLDEKDVEVTLRDKMLSISGEKKVEREESEKGVHLSERGYGTFRRSFSLPEDVDADYIRAEMQKGVMKISLPKSPTAEAKQRTIEVQAKS